MKFVIAILILSAVIIFHELGHFLLAKANHIIVTEFAIGMGPVSYPHLDVYKRQVSNLAKLKSNMDYGMFLPVQKAAIARCV